MTIRNILAGKDAGQTPAVVTIIPEATVAELIELLTRHNIGAVVVSRSGDVVEGIVSERDVVRNLAQGPDVLAWSVGDIMTSEVATLGPDDELEPVHAQMTEARIRHLPVVDDGRLVGIISIGDVVKSHIEQVTFERDQLDSYIQQ